MARFEKQRKTRKKQWAGILFFLTALFLADHGLAQDQEKVNGIYLPPLLSRTRIDKAIHHAGLSNLNAFVLHVKDPLGQIYWQSEHPMARKIGAIQSRGRTERIVKQLRQEGIRTIAKVDVFQDSLLPKGFPRMGVQDIQSGNLWADRKGLHWLNPYDREVWDYNVALCKELIAMGFEEIQFDYARFPSDGKLRHARYPVVLDGMPKARCIGEFLKFARAELKPMGAVLSVDVFGLTAWLKEDFGVGQVLEEIAPHVDVICPMLYPSHFPPGFMGWKKPGDYPGQVVEMSMKRIKARTKKDVRPWVQGFWYTTEEIMAQIEAVLDSGTSSWTVWNPSGRYMTTYNALTKLFDLDPSEKGSFTGARKEKDGEKASGA